MLMFAHKAGPDPRHTAAPGDDPWACSTSGCHTGLPQGGPLNAYGGSVSATFSNGSFYTPGQPVTITVTVADPNPPESQWHGFQMSARLESDLVNGQAGSFRYTSGTGIFVLCDDGSVEGIIRQNNACPANAPVEFIEHNEPSMGTWTFTWNPPATDQGPIHFYVAGNAVVLDDNPDEKDHVYTKEYVLRPLAASCAQAPPTISEVRRFEGFGDGSTFSSGSWLWIKGSNLAQTTGTWLDADFSAGVARTTLGGTSVSVNGKPAFVEYISPTQVNFQTPDDAATGPVAFTLTNCAGTASPPAKVSVPQQLAVAPGMLTPSTGFVFNNKQYVVAQFYPNYLFVGPSASGLFRPAKPHEVVWMFGIGFGEVQGTAVAGTLASGSGQIVAPVTISFGQTAANVIYKGLYPSYAGLYLFIVEVPAVADGEYQINMTLNGQPLQQPPFFLTVHK